MQGLLLLVSLGAMPFVRAQEGVLRGAIRDLNHRIPISGISVGYDSDWVLTDSNGAFVISVKSDSLILTAFGRGYQTGRFPVVFREGSSQNLGNLWLEPIQESDAEEDVVLLNPDLENEASNPETGMPLLRGTRDLFTTRATFDFGSAFFKIRGQDSRENEVYFNGLVMNRSYDGRPAWSTWSGLTDITRGARQVPNFELAEGSFGGVLGAIHISASPSILRSGTKLTTSIGNNGYQFRLAATYNSGINRYGLGWLLALSRRWGSSGITEGSSLRAHAGYLALEWQPHNNHGFLISAIMSASNRGGRAPLTSEVIEIKGTQYNPYWGWYRGSVKNVREREINEPYLMLRYRFNRRNTEAMFASGYQWGTQMRTRLSYANSPNPDPTYYRYLPSFYYNTPSGANYENTNLAEQYFERFSQLDWEAMIRANRQLDGPAAYLMLADEQSGARFQIRSFAKSSFPRSGISIQGSLTALWDNTRYSGRVIDVLGASYFIDRDEFSNTLNDLKGSSQKGTGDRAGYDYALLAKELTAVFQAHWTNGPWEAGFSILSGRNFYNRSGYFKNERYPEISEGKGPELRNQQSGIKATLGYRISNHYWFVGAVSKESLPPLLKEVYVDPREHNQRFPISFNANRQAESVDLFVRYPWLNGRLSLFAVQSKGNRALKNYFAETAFGTAFVREITGNLGSQHVGLETGLEFRLSSSVSLTWASSYGSNTHITNPQMWLYCYPKPEAEQLLQQSGRFYLGEANLKGYHLSGGPERAAGLGIAYRDPDFWWLELRANVLDRAFEDLAVIRYTDSFSLLPETGMPDLIADANALSAIRRQNPLEPIHQLNFSAGKSWKKENHYVSFFLGLNNLFNQTLPIGGFQQGRKATYSGLLEDQKSGHPSFGSKYWYHAGRTCFINLSWSF